MRLFVFASICVVLSFTAAAQSRTGVVTGKVQRADGMPAREARVAAMAVPATGSSGGDVVYMSVARSDETGQYRLENIPSGRYYIVGGSIAAPTYYPGTTNSAMAREVSVVAGGTVADIDFTIAEISLQPPISALPRFGTSTLNAVTSNGQPIRRIAGKFTIEGQADPIVINAGRITAVRVSDSAQITVESNVNGSFQLSLNDGDYRLRATAPRGYTIKSIFAGSTDLSSQVLRVDSTYDTSGGSFGGQGNARTPPPRIVITLVQLRLAE